MPQTASPWRLVGFLWIAYLINYVDRQAVYSIFPALRQDLGFTDQTLGLIGSVFTWVYSLCMAATGRVADLVRRDRLVIGSMVLWSCATAGTALSRSVGDFLVWRAVMGITEAFYVPAALGLIASMHPGPTRSRALALHATAQFAGIFAGGWYGGWTADNIGWRTGFWLMGVVGLAYAAALVGIFRRLPAPQPLEKRASGTLADVFRARCFVTLAGAFFAFCLALYVYYGWLPAFLYERFHLSMTAAGFNATLYLQVSCSVGVLLGGALGDKLGSRVPGGRFYIAGCGLLACTPFAYITFSLQSLWLVNACTACFGFLCGFFIANIFASAFDVVAPNNYGFASGTLNLVGGLSGGSAIFGAGLLKGKFGLAGVVEQAAILTAVGAVALLAVTSRSFRADRLRAGYHLETRGT